MIDIQEKKEKIISFLETNGPSLPVRIAKAIEMDPVVASAITSELLNSKQVKTSHIKIGASPLYFLPGQEQQLEKHIDNLKPTEKNAFLKLKKNQLIKNKNEEPAIRVALQNIKDFAVPFKFQEETMWKYAFADDNEIKKLLSPQEKKSEVKKDTEQKPEKTPDENSGIKKEKPEPEIEIPKNKSPEEVPKAWEVKKEEIKQIRKKSEKIENIFTPSKSEEKTPEPEFLTEIKNFLKQKNIKFLEEIRTEKKEIMAVVNITSQLGNMNFLLIAKNKKTTTKDEIEAAIQIATKNKMPCLLIIRKEPSKSIQKFIEKNYLIRLEIM